MSNLPRGYKGKNMLSTTEIPILRILTMSQQEPMGKWGCLEIEK
jgi:hypothetical protein